MPEAARERQDLFCVFPNALLFLEADWLQAIGVSPAAADRTVEHMAVFVDRGAAGEGLAVSRKELCDVLYQVNDQDLPVLARLQAGRRSPGSDATWLVPAWDQVTAHFLARVVERAGYDR